MTAEQMLKKMNKKRMEMLDEEKRRREDAEREAAERALEEQEAEQVAFEQAAAAKKQQVIDCAGASRSCSGAERSIKSSTGGSCSTGTRTTCAGLRNIGKKFIFTTTPYEPRQQCTTDVCSRLVLLSSRPLRPLLDRSTIRFSLPPRNSWV